MAIARGNTTPPVLRPATGGAAVRLSSADRDNSGRSGLGESSDEVQRGLGDLPPTVVDREGVASVRHLHDLGHGGVTPFPLVSGVRDCPRHRVVLLAVDDQQRTAVGVLGVYLR